MAILEGIPCMTSSSYKIISESEGSGLMKIEKKHDVRSMDNLEKPAIRMSGTSTFLFDKELGIPTSSDFKGEIVLNRTRGELLRLRIPLTFSYRLRTKAEIEKSKVENEERLRLAEAAAKKRAAPPSKADRAVLLADIKSRVHEKMRRALLVLGPKIPDKPDKELSKAILSLVSYKKDTLVKYYARTAIKNWVAPESVKSIGTMLRRSVVKKDSSLRNALIEGLGGSKSASAAKILVTILENPSSPDRYQAVLALKKLGPIAETYTAKLLSSTYDDIKVAACDILKTIGTKKSLPALENAKNSGSSRVASTAKRSISAIKDRG